MALEELGYSYFESGLCAEGFTHLQGKLRTLKLIAVPINSGGFGSSAQPEFLDIRKAD